MALLYLLTFWVIISFLLLGAFWLAGTDDKFYELLDQPDRSLGERIVLAWLAPATCIIVWALMLWHKYRHDAEDLEGWWAVVVIMWLGVFA